MNVLIVIVLVLVGAGLVQAQEITNPPPTKALHPLAFIDTSFENASPVWYEFAQDGAVLIRLLYDHERASPKGAFRNSGTLGDGWLERYGIDAVVHEFNCNWIAGLEDYPSAQHWRGYGTNLATVFFEYFDRIKATP